MATIAVAGTDRRKEEELILESLRSRGAETFFVDPATVSSLFIDGRLELRHGEQPLNDVDILFMRRTRFDLEASRDLVAAADRLGIRTVERKAVFYNPLSKFYSLLSFVGQDLNIGIPDTGLVRTRSQLATTAERIGHPVVVKPVEGREGEGVQKISDGEELQESVDDIGLPAIVQRYLDVDEEYRVLVVGNTALGAVRKEPEEDSLTRNYAAGAAFEPADIGRVENDAVAIARKLGIEVAGVDLVRTVSGEYFEIECNRCPQFTGFMEARPETDVPGRIADYLITEAEAQDGT